MTYNVKDCTRCGSSMIQNHAYGPESLSVWREHSNGETESKQVRLCSVCNSELWDWVDGEDAPDRSDTVDPVQLDRVGNSVQRHIDELEALWESLQENKG